MANLAVFASGNGSNFQTLAEALGKTSHAIRCLICDRKNAYVFTRSQLLKIPSHYVSYKGKTKEQAEEEIIHILQHYDIDLIALAGFMRLLTPKLIDAYPGRIVNIHPSLLPKYPGEDAILRSYNSPDEDLGITIHQVDDGMDTGAIIMQKSFRRTGLEGIEEIEKKIHALEHQYYPEVIINLLDALRYISAPW
ncbi:MAG: phosphoribosylglycinamide formyltransferase [Spirochaetota bacterium]